MVGPKMQDFAQESTFSKEIFFKQSCDELLFGGHTLITLAH